MLSSHNFTDLYTYDVLQDCRHWHQALQIVSQGFLPATLSDVSKTPKACDTAVHLHPSAFIITPPKPVDVLELEIPTRQHLEQVKERRKGDRERTPVRELRLRETGGCVSMILDPMELKTVLSNYKNVRTLFLDFGIVKGALEPGTKRQIFAPVSPGNLP